MLFKFSLYKVQIFLHYKKVLRCIIHYMLLKKHETFKFFKSLLLSRKSKIMLMKITSGLLITALVTIVLFNACGPSEEELAQQELARQDSLEQVYQQEAEEIRQDNPDQLNQADQTNQDESATDPNNLNETPTSFEYSENGTFTVQIEAWRSERKARNQAEMWKQRNFDHAFVIKYGDAEAGDIWYRVRLGKFETREMAQNFKAMLKKDYNTESWVSKTNEPRGNARVMN